MDRQEIIYQSQTIYLNGIPIGAYNVHWYLNEDKRTFRLEFNTEIIDKMNAHKGKVTIPKLLPEAFELSADGNLPLSGVMLEDDKGAMWTVELEDYNDNNATTISK